MKPIESRPWERNRPPAGRATVPPRVRDVIDDDEDTVVIPQVPVMRPYQSRCNNAVHRWPRPTPQARCDTGLVL